MTCGAVLAAGGQSARMGEIDKTVAKLAGRPVIDWVLDAFAHSPAVSELVVVTSERNAAAVRAALDRQDWSIPVRITAGGVTRQDSVAAGVRRLSPDATLVLIHDVARPLVTPALIDGAVAAGAELGAVVTALPVTDTIKRVAADGSVLETLDRSALRAVQTPQVFRRDWLEMAYQLAMDVLVTDEAALLERAGFTVHTIPGTRENIKLTTPLDMRIAEALIIDRQSVAER